MQLTAGAAEVFGSELQLRTPVKVTGQKLAVRRQPDGCFPDATQRLCGDMAPQRGLCTSWFALLVQVFTWQGCSMEVEGDPAVM